MFDQAGEVAEQPLLGRVLEVEGWQHHAGPTAQVDGVPGQVDGARQIGQAGTHHQYAGVDAAIHEGLQGRDSLPGAHRQGLTGGTEGG